jgi:CRISPR/Cas system CMR subunit Cmr4 (Cas7 group RAMP superfamily)
LPYPWLAILAAALYDVRPILADDRHANARLWSTPMTRRTQAERDEETVAEAGPWTVNAEGWIEPYLYSVMEEDDRDDLAEYDKRRYQRALMRIANRLNAKGRKRP